MLTISLIKRVYGGPICRACIREQFKIDLEREDCRYLTHSGICPRCHEKAHIVKGFRLSGYRKGFFR